SLALRISRDTELSPYQLSGSGYSARKAIEKIYSYTAESVYFDVLAICLNDSDKLYTSSGTVDIDTFVTSTFWPTENLSTEDLLELMRSKEYYGGTKDGQYVMSGYTQYSIMTYPLGKTWGTYYGTLIGIYKNNWEDIFQEEMAERDKRLVIVCDDNMDMLYTQIPESMTEGLNQTEDLIEPLAMLLQKWNENEKYYEFSLRGEDYVGKIAHSNVSGWYLINMVEEQAVSGDLVLMYLPMIMFIFLSMLLLTICLSVVLSMYNYRPIQQLYHLFDKKMDNKRLISEKDELLFLNEYIRKLLDEQNVIEERLDTNIKVSRMELIKKLLRSSLDVTSPEVKEQMEHMGVHLGKEYMAVIVIGKHGKKSNIGIKLKKALRECQHDSFYLTENIYKEYDAFLACVEDVEEIIKFAEWLSEEMEQESGVQIGIGNTYSTVESLKYSLIEAIIAAESGKERVICYSNISTHRNGEFYCTPLESERKLKRLLNQGATENLDKTLDELRRELLHIWQFGSDTVLFFLMNRIFGSLFENSLCLSENEGEKYLHYTDLEEFLVQIREFCCAELQCRLEQKTLQEDVRIKSIITFVEENYMCQEMSLSWVADKFDMTGPYLSRIFKTAMDKNFINYITDKRLNLAAKLLVETDETIGEIVEKVGYSDVASFTRKFTRYFLVSPGNYRKMEREKRKNVNA
ncbi:MAG: helix-turn-helix domain-containing protein, partial [Roseburia sp.]|nr:helix-turn-helix domain-containing protein [Roseburia sp.]